MTEETAFAETQEPNSAPAETSAVSTSETAPPQGEAAQTEASDTSEQKQENGAELTPEERENKRILDESRQRSESRLRGTERRMAELTEARYAEKARADFLEAQLAAQQQRAAPQAQGMPQMPQRENYGSFEEWQDARTVYMTQRAMMQFLGNVSQQNQTAQQASEWNQRLDRMQSNLSKSQAEFQKSTPDYADVVTGHDEQVPWPAAMTVMEHPQAAQMMYHMGKNPTFVRSLQSMSPTAQAVAIGELAATLRSGPQVSKASRPGEPVGSKPGSAGEPPLDTGAYFEWAKKNLK